MKRVTALMLLAALILSAASCGGTDTPAAGDDTTAGFGETTELGGVPLSY